MSDSVRYELLDNIAVITLDDGKANALSPAVLRALHAHLDRAEKEAGAVLLVGRPGRLSAGFDLSVMTGDPDAMRQLVLDGAELLLRMYLFPRPIVTACTGHALAAGAILLLASDYRIAARGNFKIGLNEVAIQLPLPVFAVELARDRLARRHFTQAATQARIYDPDGALEAGYVDAVEPAESLMDAALHHARRLAALPDPAFRLTKESERGATVRFVRESLRESIGKLTTPVVG